MATGAVLAVAGCRKLRRVVLPCRVCIRRLRVRRLQAQWKGGGGDWGRHAAMGSTCRGGLAEGRDCACVSHRVGACVCVARVLAVVSA